MITIYLSNIKNHKNLSFLDNVLSNISEFRKIKYDTFQSDEAKLQVLLSSYLIDEYLKKRNLREKNMKYKLNKAGKPYFENHNDIYFSISHSKNMVGVAFSDREVGFDVQVVKNVDLNILGRVLSKDEQSDVKLEEHIDREKFYYYWVIKEAILKRDGTGLRDDISDVCDDSCLIDKMVDDDDIYYMCVNNKFDSSFTKEEL